MTIADCIANQEFQPSPTELQRAGQWTITPDFLFITHINDKNALRNPDTRFLRADLHDA
ncbi:hypothetical protein AA0243_3078 [Novacetimonas hansenii NRIC 0243]|nr:hypothetical protein AA0243_3078 [Novacetimonas hansenii NRIC 0243]